jgi:hypothetical protein
MWGGGVGVRRSCWRRGPPLPSSWPDGFSTGGSSSGG